MSKKILSTNITSVLNIISRRLEHDDIDWVIITSCALALHGLDIEPMDVDILTDEYGLLKIDKALCDYKILLSENNSPSAIFDSTMSTFCINGFSVEVMSGFKIKSSSDDVWYGMDYLLKYCTMIDIGNRAIPVLPLLQLIEMYKLMGRDKDMIKIEKIERHLMKFKALTMEMTGGAASAKN